jgi:acetyltransferase-like isoleucine patch superfamily enzyme
MSSLPASTLGRLAAAARRLREERRDRLAAHRQRAESFTTERLLMGPHSYGEPLIPTYPGDSSWVRIGAFVSIALDVVMMDGGNHRTDWISTYPFRLVFGMQGALEDGHPFSKGDILVGNDVWIGRGARILSGITIGDGAVIGGYSVVTKDVRPYAIVAGNPAREIRRRFEDEQVEALLRIAWWHWPLEKVLAAVPELCSENVDAFIAAHLPGAPGGAQG